MSIEMIQSLVLFLHYFSEKTKTNKKKTIIGKAAVGKTGRLFDIQYPNTDPSLNLLIEGNNQLGGGN